jgi:GNAT superfamily N-acetyltransferase
MHNMAHSIRPARDDDANFLAWAILIAARSHLAEGWFDIALEGSEGARLDYLRRLTLNPTRSWWHFSRFLVAEQDGIPVGALSVFRAGDAYPLSQQAMAKVARELGWNDAAQQAMWQRGAYIFACTSESDDDAWAIENVATLPSYRGRGIAGALLGHAVAEAERNGARRVQITFYIGNEAAERAYAKAGFKFHDEKRNADFEAATGAPGLRRYVRDLPPTKVKSR